ncbi:E3 ubiquitin-protein ligase RING1-like [Apostasia shenzhenica]|uniref:RING-type E3 ubiquitin transferase n=1 Tax=Apostasia shenzhenica TaxID=1088818 RepID=A0A2I0B202_9ASPA|nr:E3 ubiquitin-protein ligase RING1-like [Apostasia shenzhenica]
MDDNHSSIAARNSWRRHRRRRLRHGSSESVDNMLSQHFSQLIGLATQGRDLHIDEDTTVSFYERPNFTVCRNLSRWVRRVHSDTDNDNIDFVDSLFGETDSPSLFGETDSHISIGGDGGDSDASVDGHSMLGREMFSPYGSHMHSDTDIDPMHAGLDHWTSDDQGEYGEWEEGARTSSIDLMEPSGQIQNVNSPQNGAWIHWRVRHVDLFTDLDELDLSNFAGNSADYLDAQGFEELLERLALADSSIRGAPPASASSVHGLPCVIISKDHEKNGPIICAICKEQLPIETEAKQLPCSHLYHSFCILPWLRSRNSCPVCRYELPTDDPEYKGKRNDMVTEIDVIRQPEPSDESYSNGSSEIGGESEIDEQNRPLDQANINDGGQAAGRSSHGGNGGWILLAAAPIVSIVGIVIAIWVGNSMNEGRIRHNIRDHGLQQSQRTHGTVVQANRNRRWWSLLLSGQR